MGKNEFTETNENAQCKANGRLLFLDVMKVIALILMPCIHAFNMTNGFGLTGDLFPTDTVSVQMGVIYLIVPGVFMFCMGAGIVLSKKRTPKALFSRGLRLLLTGFVLNVLRASIFIWLGLLGSERLYLEFWYWLWGSDILYFAGLYFLLFSLFRKWKLSDTAIAVISVVMLLVSHFIMPVHVENESLVEILGNFVYIDSDSVFPLLSWSVFPTVGYLYMKYIAGGSQKVPRIAAASAMAALTLGITSGILLFTNNMQSRYFLWGEQEFMMDVPTAAIAVSTAVLFAGIIFFVSSFIKNKRVISFIEKIGANVNLIYCIHWVLLAYFVFLWLEFSDYRLESVPGVYLLGLLIFGLSAFLALIYRRYKSFCF